MHAMWVISSTLKVEARRLADSSTKGLRISEFEKSMHLEKNYYYKRNAS
jgi:hypothetical protein